MPALKLSIAILFILLMPLKTEGRNAEAIWDSRCEECHGDNARFARKYLWNIDEELRSAPRGQFKSVHAPALYP